jgi:hypothetical protein
MLDMRGSILPLFLSLEVSEKITCPPADFRILIYPPYKGETPVFSSQYIIELWWAVYQINQRWIQL